MKAELKAKSAPSLTDKWGGENGKRKTSHSVASSWPCFPGLAKGIVKARMNFKILRKVPLLNANLNVHLSLLETHHSSGKWGYQTYKSQKSYQANRSSGCSGEKGTGKTDTYGRQVKREAVYFYVKASWCLKPPSPSTGLTITPVPQSKNICLTYTQNSAPPLNLDSFPLSPHSQLTIFQRHF